MKWGFSFSQKETAKAMPVTADMQGYRMAVEKSFERAARIRRGSVALMGLGTIGFACVSHSAVCRTVSSFLIAAGSLMAAYYRVDSDEAFQAMQMEKAQRLRAQYGVTEDDLRRVEAYEPKNACSSTPRGPLW